MASTIPRAASTVAGTGDRVRVLGLYRQLLRFGQVFPSVNRGNLLYHIRVGNLHSPLGRVCSFVSSHHTHACMVCQIEYRVNRDETDPAAIAKAIQHACDGVTYMQTYSQQHNPDPASASVLDSASAISVDLAATSSMMGTSTYTPDLRPPNWRVWRQMSRGEIKPKR